jgi:hypothetical protein
MTAELGMALAKLVLGLAVFVALGYLGKFYDKRIAGVLLTFPILNGIGILTGDDPLAVANSIYPVVVFNGLNLFFMIGLCARLTPFSGASDNTKLIARVILWMAIWAVGAPLITIFRDHLPGIVGVLLIQLSIAALAVLLVWKPPRRAPDNDNAPSRLSLRQHMRAVIALWGNGSGALRISLFVLCCAALFLVAEFGASKWLGMFSAVPLPGLFAIATLSVMNAEEDFNLMRDSILIGPIGVNAFNWLYAQTVVHLPATGHDILGIIALVAMLLTDAALIFWIVPRISVYLDRVRQ